MGRSSPLGGVGADCDPIQRQSVPHPCDAAIGSGYRVRGPNTFFATGAPHCRAPIAEDVMAGRTLLARLAVACAMTLNIGGAAARQPSAPPASAPIIENAEADQSANVLYVRGLSFGAAQGTSTLSLGGAPVAVALDGWSATDIVAGLPAGLRPGSYLLVLKTSAGESRFEVTLGAVGAQGIQGPPGAGGPFKVVDGAGNELGSLASVTPPAITEWSVGRTTYYWRKNGLWYVTNDDGAAQFISNYDIYYSQADCAGQAYLTYPDAETAKTYALFLPAGSLGKREVRVVGDGFVGKAASFLWASNPTFECHNMNLADTVETALAPVMFVQPVHPMADLDAWPRFIRPVSFR